MIKRQKGLSKRAASSLKSRHFKESFLRDSDVARNGGLLNTDVERVERLREVFQSLYEINKRIPVIVEGRKDVDALRKIGLVGDIIALHSGQGLYEFCEDIAEKSHRIILLMDWDERGENLYRNVSERLKGLWEEFSPFREVLRLLCQKDVKDIEGIPALLERLAGSEVTVRELDAS